MATLKKYHLLENPSDETINEFAEQGYVVELISAAGSFGTSMLHTRVYVLMSKLAEEPTFMGVPLSEFKGTMPTREEAERILWEKEGPKA